MSVDGVRKKITQEGGVLGHKCMEEVNMMSDNEVWRMLHDVHVGM